MTTSYIIQIGVAVPLKISQRHSALYMAKMLNYDEKETKKLVRLYKKTAIEYRHTVLDPPDENQNIIQQQNISSASTSDRMKLYQTQACSLAKNAIKDGIDEKYLSKITHLITVSCTGMYAPGLDIELVADLKLSDHIQRTCINFMGCYGVFNALKMADYICRANPEAYVLIVSVELCTLHFQPMRTMDNLFANAIFADGAACALVHSQPLNEKNLLLKSFRCELAYETQAMTWFIGNQGFDIQLSSYVPSLLQGNAHAMIERLLSKLQMTVKDIQHFAIHPGGKDVLSSIETALEINPEKNSPAHYILKNFGNMSSATILFVLKHLLASLSKPNHRQNILAMAFGPGLTMESGLLEINFS